MSRGRPISGGQEAGSTRLLLRQPSLTLFSKPTCHASVPVPAAPSPRKAERNAPVCMGTGVGELSGRQLGKAILGEDLGLRGGAPPPTPACPLPTHPRGGVISLPGCSFSGACPGLSQGLPELPPGSPRPLPTSSAQAATLCLAVQMEVFSFSSCLPILSPGELKP